MILALLRKKKNFKKHAKKTDLCCCHNFITISFLCRFHRYYRVPPPPMQPSDISDAKQIPTRRRTIFKFYSRCQYLALISLARLLFNWRRRLDICVPFTYVTRRWAPNPPGRGGGTRTNGRGAGSAPARIRSTKILKFRREQKMRHV